MQHTEAPKGASVRLYHPPMMYLGWRIEEPRPEPHVVRPEEETRELGNHLMESQLRPGRS